MAGRWLSPDTPVSSTNKTDRHDITEILLKVALNTINRAQCLIGSLLNNTCTQDIIVYLYIFYTLWC
jgi:hypothetical protein